MVKHTSQGTVPWPAEDAEIYRAQGYWEDKPLGAYLQQSALQFPDRVAIVDGADGTRMSYAELIDRADAAAERLLALGLERDDRVLVVLPNGWQFVVFTIACFRAGIIPVMALPAHRQYELRFLGALAEARAIVTADEIKGFDYQQLIAELRPEIPTLQWALISGAPTDGNLSLEDLLRPGKDPNGARARLDAAAPAGTDPALFLLSGGTTGLPKLITRTHNDYAYNIKACSGVAGLSQDSVYLVSMPASHNFPLACPGVLGALLLGARVVTLPSPNPARAFPAIAAEGVTITAVVPAVAQKWIEYQEEHRTDQLTTLQVLQVGGSRMPDEVARKVKPVLGATLQQVFGMAEGLINMTRRDDPEEVICTTQGRPVSAADEIRIVDPLLQDLPDGTPGAILTRGPYTPRGYYAAPEANAKSFEEGGWYASGDIVERRPDGNLIVQGRDKDMINRGGEKISAEEIESLVYQIPGLSIVAAVSMPDPVLGEKVCLYAQMAGGDPLTLEQVQAHLKKAGIAAYKIPEKVVVVEEIPTTKVGKIDKKALRADISERMQLEV
ncbi:AMP-binding protein [Micrococcus luteus]|uniref:(2,3-dihydroxybenzoyl)adenylate synthase n=1 Tax=Micrococcus luteus TaxID=1270 RepID=UPI000C7BFE92|nr:AMP-binding protein [Micrococcus luteus]MDK7330308.1 AMP-binding protein [Micrococcus luteus]PLA41435.1 2,3-dihydroxybenzoate-AMP ligase [Micrococcus luteus]